MDFNHTHNTAVHKWIQRQTTLLLRRLKGNYGFYWANRIIAGLADPHYTMLVIWMTKKRPGDMRASIRSIVHLQQVKLLILKRKTSYE